MLVDPRRILGDYLGSICEPGHASAEGELGMSWGRFGSAGFLAVDVGHPVLLQYRAIWFHQGGMWSLPFGARTT